MALDFPPNPTIGQIYTAPNGTTWIWDGTKWTAQSSEGNFFLPLAGGILASPGNLTVRGGLLTGPGGAVPTTPGNVTLNINAATPPAGLAPNLYVVGPDGGAASVGLDVFSNTPAQAPYILTRRARGTAASPASVQSGDILINVQGAGYGGNAYGAGNNVGISGQAAENWTVNNHGSSLYLQTTVLGSLTPVNSLVLQGNAAQFSGGVGVGTAAVAGGNGTLVLNANTVAPPAPIMPSMLMISPADNVGCSIEVDAYGASPNPTLIGRRQRGTSAAPSAVQLGDGLLLLEGYGYGASAYGASPAVIALEAAENYTATAQGTRMRFVLNNIGTTSPVNAMILQGNAATFSGSATLSGGSLLLAGSGARVSADTTNVAIQLPTGNGSVFFTSNPGANMAMVTPGAGGFGEVRATSGFKCQPGAGAAADAHVFNIFYGSGPAHLWIDTSDLGSINLTPCDERLKKNLEPPTVDALAAVNAIALKQFDWLANDLVPEHHEDIGFTAQQLHEAIPNAVTVHEDEEQMLSVQLTPIVAHLIGAVQQLSAQNADLLTRLAALEAKLT